MDSDLVGLNSERNLHIIRPPKGRGEASKPKVSLPRLPRVFQVVDSMRADLHAGSVMVQPFFSASPTTPSTRAEARVEQVVACCAARRPLPAGGRVHRCPRPPFSD